MPMTSDPHNPQAAERDTTLARYTRQVIYKHMGEEAQRKLLASRAVLIGCGALGTVLADTLVRAGVGFLRVVDRDTVELNNLQRQVLFDERDAAEGAPKAVAAAARLAAINSDVTIEPVVADANPANIESLAESAHILLDGTDNFETRFLINDVAVKHGIPWVYGACVGAEGMVMPILPGITPCLRCIWDRPPPPGMNPTCDTAGVLAPIVHIVAGLQAIAAIRILTDQVDSLNRKLLRIDAWTGRIDPFDMQAAHDTGDCPCCKAGRYDHLAGRHTGHTAILCGRDAVQISPGPDTKLDLEEMAAKIAPVAKSAPQINRYLLRFEVDRYQITLFRDGRAIIKGTVKPDEGRSVYAKYVGS